MIAWGLTTGQWSVPELVQKLVGHGYEWVAVEWDDPYSQDVNRGTFPELKARMNAAGGAAGPWFTEGGSVYLTPPDADFTIAEQEGPGDYTGIVYCEEHGLIPPSVSKGVCTNFSTIGYAEARFLIDRDWTCLPEAYMNEMPAASPAAVNGIARSLGWPTSQPVAGVYPVGGNPAPSYEQWADWPLIDYLGEYVLDVPFSTRAATAWQQRRYARRVSKRAVAAASVV